MLGQIHHVVDEFENEIFTYNSDPREDYVWGKCNTDDTWMNNKYQILTFLVEQYI